MSQPVHILEFTRVVQARRIDEDQGVLYDLAVLGPESLNGRDWPESTMKDMLPLLEGRQAFADHARGGEPSVYHVLGVWRGCRVREGKTRGDFHYFKSHPLASRLVEAARRPELNNALGFSINARGRTAARNGRQVVEGVDEVISIDCVAQPATLAGLYESKGKPVMKTLSEWVTDLRRSRPLYAQALEEVAEAGILGPEDAMPAPAEPDADEGSGDHEAALKAGFKSAINACLDDDSMDLKAKMKRIKEILKSQEKLLGGDKSADAPAEDAPAEESRRAENANLKEEVGRLRSQARVRAAADAAKVIVPAALLESLGGDLSDAQARKIVNELKGTPALQTQRPRSAAPRGQAPAQAGRGPQRVSESTEAPPSDPAKLGRWLNGR